MGRMMRHEHREMIEYLCSVGFHRLGYIKNVVKAVSHDRSPLFGENNQGDELRYSKIEWNDTIHKCKRIPDAYKICETCKIITIVEVNHSVPKIPRQKMLDYAYLWLMLDCEYWELRLILMDWEDYNYIKNTGKIRYREIDLQDVYYNNIEEV